MRIRGSVAPILGFVLFALVLAGCASRQSPAAGGGSQQQGTKTETVHPYDASGQLSIKVADVARGSCWTMSVAAPAPDAYRCFAGNTILDPCFAPTGQAAPTEVACLAAPWSNAEMLTLTAPLPKINPADASVRPWALELGNGVRCVASTGTVPAVQGVNLGYRCTDGAYAGLIDTKSATVTADYGDATAQTVQSVTVTTIWRG
jgi:hypothetical protein